MPLSKLKSGNPEEFENGGRPSGSHSVPIACRVCDRVFFDNISLVLHFECHVNDGYRLRGRDLASLRSGQQLSSSRSPYSRSSLARMNGAHHVAHSRVNDRIRRPLPANRTPKQLNIPYVPAATLKPSLKPTFGAQLNLSQPIHQAMTSQHGGQNGGSRLREQNGGRTYIPDYKNAPINQLEKPNQVVIIISDDEDDKSTPEIDLTLKL